MYIYIGKTNRKPGKRRHKIKFSPRQWPMITPVGRGNDRQRRRTVLTDDDDACQRRRTTLANNDDVYQR